MNITIISLIISALVALVQVWKFFDHRGSKIEAKLNAYAKADDVQAKLADLNSAIEHNKNLTTKIASNLIVLNTDVKVLSERVNNEINQTSKLLDKLADKLDELDNK